MNRLVKLGAEALKPRKHYDGIQWLAPIVSRRQANVLRKRALREGSYGTIGKNPETGKVKGWDPAWDVFQSPIPRPLQPQKLHKNQRTRASRAKKITEKLGEQAKKMQEITTIKVKEKNAETGILKLLRQFKSTAFVQRRKR